MQGQFLHGDEHIQNADVDTYMQLCHKVFIEDHFKALLEIVDADGVLDRMNSDGTVTSFVVYLDSFVGDTQEYSKIAMTEKLHFTESCICSKCCTRSENVVRELQVDDLMPRCFGALKDLVHSIKSRQEWKDADTHFKIPIREDLEAICSNRAVVDPPGGIRTDGAHCGKNNIDHTLGVMRDADLLPVEQRPEMFMYLQAITKKYRLCKAPLQQSLHFDENTICGNLTISQTKGLIVMRCVCVWLCQRVSLIGIDFDSSLCRWRW